MSTLYQIVTEETVTANEVEQEKNDMITDEQNKKMKGLYWILNQNKKKTT